MRSKASSVKCTLLRTAACKAAWAAAQTAACAVSHIHCSEHEMHRGHRHVGAMQSAAERVGPSVWPCVWYCARHATRRAPPPLPSRRRRPRPPRRSALSAQGQTAACRLGSAA
eukprot:6177269-Pleurochrysis_carterae.AAC.2